MRCRDCGSPARVMTAVELVARVPRKDRARLAEWLERLGPCSAWRCTTCKAYGLATVLMDW